MNRTTKRALTVSALALGLIAAATTANAATTGIAGTRHNLGSSNRVLTASGAWVTTPASANVRAGDVFTNATDEICVFCHTPHATNTAVTAPLWNKAISPALAGAGYKMYSSGTMQSSVTNLNSGSMSLACLSCHDGTQAMDNMINAPGGNGYNATGASLGTGAQWSADGADTINGIMQTTAGIVMLGTDLSNDHPVGIPYGGGGCTVGVDLSCNDKDFHAMVANSVSGASGGFQVGSSPIQKNNMRLYGPAASATVECASCHDPHNDVNKTFLRVDNAGSAVCLTCHVK